jgi:hypothetical protein
MQRIIARTFYPSRLVSGRTVAVHRRAPQREHRIRFHQHPTTRPILHCRKSFRLRNARMSTRALQREYVLPEIIGQLHDGEGRARRHHGLYIHTAAR